MPMLFLGVCAVVRGAVLRCSDFVCVRVGDKMMPILFILVGA